jgi:hypothetical protein
MVDSIPPCHHACDNHTDSDIEDNQWWKGCGMDNKNGAIVEGSVASVLWDIFDANTDSDEVRGVVENGFQKIWEVLSLDHPEDIFEFYDAIVRRNPGDQGALTGIFMTHKIPIRVSMPWTQLLLLDD